MKIIYKILLSLLLILILSITCIYFLKNEEQFSTECTISVDENGALIVQQNSENVLQLSLYLIIIKLKIFLLSD